MLIHIRHSHFRTLQRIYIRRTAYIHIKYMRSLRQFPVPLLPNLQCCYAFSHTSRFPAYRIGHYYDNEVLPNATIR